MIKSAHPNSNGMRKMEKLDRRWNRILKEGNFLPFRNLETRSRNAKKPKL